MPSTMSRLRLRTACMFVVRELERAPYSSPWRNRCDTLALQISFLLGRQLMFGQEPPIQRRSTTATLWPAAAMCHARNPPPLPLPRIRYSYRSIMVRLRNKSHRIEDDLGHEVRCRGNGGVVDPLRSRL